MEEFTKNLLKDLQKNLEKISVLAIGGAKIQKSYTSKQDTKKQEETAIESAKKALDSSSKTLGSSIKGQFGTKITKVFEKQQQTLDNI